MRALLLVAIAVLIIDMSACGSGGGGSTSNIAATTVAVGKPSRSPAASRVTDRDHDGDNNTDDQHVFDYGHPADPADRRAIVELVKRYFAAAAAHDGATACLLLTPFVAESVVERVGRSSALHGRTCAVVMVKVFKHSHDNLTVKSADLTVGRVGVEGDKALVAIEFPGQTEMLRQVTVRWHNGRWTVLTLLDGIVE